VKPGFKIKIKNDNQVSCNPLPGLGFKGLAAIKNKYTMKKKL
jgi:hypothetical protein